VHCATTEAEVRERIARAGFAPVKRDSWYRRLEPAEASPA
jgi:2-iminoacetate synthase ThiH